jgi:hypothetical protein
MQRIPRGATVVVKRSGRQVSTTILKENCVVIDENESQKSLAQEDAVKTPKKRGGNGKPYRSGIWPWL